MKLRKRILSAVLAAAMILPLALAAPQTARAEEPAPEAEIEDMLADLEEAPAMETDAAVNYNGIVDGKVEETIVAKYRGQTQSYYKSTIPAGYSDFNLMIPVKVRGGTYFTFEISGETNITSISLAKLYKDEAMTQEITVFSDYTSGKTLSDYGTSKVFAAPIEGTQSDYYVYYILVNVDIDEDYVEEDGNIRNIHFWPSYYMPSKALTAGNWVYASNMGSPKKSFYYKIKLANDGYLDLYFDNMGTGSDAFKYQICSKANAGADYAYSSGWETYDNKYGNILGLKKGTYYLRVMTGDDTFKLQYKFSAREVSTNTSTSKATVIKKGSNVDTLIPLTKDSATRAVRYYKFATTKNSTIKMNYKAFLDFGGNKTCGLKFIVYKGSPKNKDIVKWQTGKDYTSVTSTGQTSGHFTLNLSKGTYYLKVATIGKANGWFKLQYKSIS